MSQEASAEGYGEPIDGWAIASNDIQINEQQITAKEKAKLSAFGENVITSGRAEWDIQIDLESYGGITIGIYKHSKLTSKNDLNELPINENFAKTENGWGYTNKTGAVVHNNERKKYGNRLRSKETLTMSVDLLAGTLTYAIDGVSQGTAFEIPRGAYRLACCLPFKEQQVSIKRFWTSLPRDNTNSNDNESNANDAKSSLSNSNKPKENAIKSKANSKNEENEDKKQKESSKEEESNDDKKEDVALNGSEDVTSDNDNNSTDPGFEFGKDTENESPSAKERREIKKSVKKMVRSQSTSNKSEDDDDDSASESLEMIGGGVSRVRGGSMAEDSNGSNQNDEMKTDSASTKGKNKNKKSKGPDPITLPVKDDEESSDYFSLSGHNLSTEKPSILSCIRQEKGERHTGFGAQLVTHGRSEWILKIQNGHHIIIGVCGTTTHSDGLFTDYPYGFGYGDDGNIYMNGGYIEYNDGFKSGDTVGVHLDMDVGEVRFSVNEIDQGPAFSGFKPKKSGDSDIDGYRLAVSLQYRPHSVELIQSTSWLTNRISPRPGQNSNQWSFSVPHQRKLSWMTDKNKKMLNKSDSDQGSDDSKMNDANENENDDNENDNNDNNGNVKKNSKGNDSSNSNDKKDNLNVNGNASKKRPKSARKAPKSPKMKNVSKSAGGDDHTLKPSNYGKNGASSASSASSSASQHSASDSGTNWQLRNGSTDVFERSGSKLEVSANKASVSAKNDIKDGNSAIGKLVVCENMKVQWDVKIEQGSRVAVGVMNMDGKSQTAMRKLLNSFFTNDLYGYGYFGNDGGIARNGRFKKYGESYKRGDTISVILDLFNKTLSFSKNNEDQGVAFRNIPVGEYRIAITIPRNRHNITLSKVQIWDAIQPAKPNMTSASD